MIGYFLLLVAMHYRNMRNVFRTEACSILHMTGHTWTPHIHATYTMRKNYEIYFHVTINVKCLLNFSLSVFFVSSFICFVHSTWHSLFTYVFLINIPILSYSWEINYLFGFNYLNTTSDPRLWIWPPPNWSQVTVSILRNTKEQGRQAGRNRRETNRRNKV